MQPGHDPPPGPPAPKPLSYAPPDPPLRVAWLDLAGHAMFGLGLALLLGGFAGAGYDEPGAFGSFLREYYPHMTMAGAFIGGILVSVRLGPFSR